MATEYPTNNRKTVDAILTEQGLTGKGSETLFTKLLRVVLRLSAKNTANFKLVTAGTHTWAGGAAVTDAKTISGLAATDFVAANLRARAATETLILTVPTTNTLTFTLSANGTDTTTKIDYQVFRAVS